MASGHVQYLVVAFPENRFSGQIAPAIAELVDNGTIRVIDLAFVLKDANGDVMAMEYADLAPEVKAAFERLSADTEGGLFNEDDLMAAGDELEPNSSAALLVWENLWASKVRDAIRDAGGVLLDFDMIPGEVVDAARAYLAEAVNEA